MNPEMPVENQLETIELTIEEAKQKVGRMEALERLHDNPDFKAVLLEGFLEQEVLRLVRAKAFPATRHDENRQAFINSRLECAAEIQSWFNQINQEGNASKGAMADFEATREEILMEAQGIVEVK